MGNLIIIEELLMFGLDAIPVNPSKEEKTWNKTTKLSRNNETEKTAQIVIE